MLPWSKWFMMFDNWLYFQLDVNVSWMQIEVSSRMKFLWVFFLDGVHDICI